MISIVMAYYNRKELLINTLKSIGNSKHSAEIIIVDDASNEENRIEDLIRFNGLNISIIRVEPEEKTWANTCTVFNMGFKRATGDVIILQGSECLHVGDVLEYAINHTKEGAYTVFSCYSVDKEKLEHINNLDFLSGTFVEDMNSVISPINNAHPENDCRNGWYCHSTYNPCAFHFCAAISKRDLQELGGFDERYALGLAYEDCEFIRRIRGRGMDVQITDAPFVIHQPHQPTDYQGKQQLFLRNQHLYHTGEIL